MSLYKALHRIRLALMDCTQRVLARTERDQRTLALVKRGLSTAADANGWQTMTDESCDL